MSDNIVCPNVGKLVLAADVRTDHLIGAKLHLMGSAATINRTLTLSACNAVELAGSGYSALTLSAWTSLTIDGVTFYAKTSPTPDASFVPSGSSATIAGAYITDAASANLLFAWIFAGGPVTVPVGITLTLPIEIDLGSIYSN